LHRDQRRRYNQGMTANDSVTRWLRGIKLGDDAAAARIVERYSRQLLAIANQGLPKNRRRASDGEDVVQSAFASMFHRAQQGAFAQLDDRDNLWRLLVTIVRRKTANALRRQLSKRRGGGQVQGESGFGSGAIHDDPDDEPSPETAAMLRESLAALLDRLPDQELREIALLKLEQYTDEEVAAKIGRSRATVERRLRLIRSIWAEEGDTGQAVLHYPRKPT